MEERLVFFFVDDEPRITKLLTRCVQRIRPGVECREFRNGESALAALRELPSWAQVLIISDGHMGTLMTGPEFLREARQLLGQRLVRACLLSSAEEHLEAAVEDGFDKIEKPCGLPEIEDFFLKVFH
jgi:CheY-like chemotaxis protein